MNIPSSSATGVTSINSSTTMSTENTKPFQIGTIKNAVQNVENSNDNNSIIDNCKMILEQSNNANNNNQNQSNHFVNVSPSNSGLVTFLQIDPQQQINNQLLLADRQQQQQQTQFQQQQLSSIMNMQQQQQSSRFPQNIHQRRTIPSQIMLSTINQNNQQSRSQQFNVNQQENNFPTIPFGPNQSQWFAPQRQLTKGNNTMMMMMNQNNHQNLLFNNQQQPQIPIVYPSTMAIRPPPGFCPNATTAASSNNMNQWQQPSISQLSKNSEKCLTRMLSTLAYQFHQQQQQQQQMSMTHRNCPQSISSVNNNNSGNSNQQSVIYDFVNPNFTQATNMTATEQCNNNHNHWPQTMLGCGQGHNGQTRFNHPLMTRLFCPQSIYFQQQQQQRLTLLQQQQQQQQNQIINQFQCLANYNEQMNDENTNNRSFQFNKNGQNLNPNATDFFPTIINNNNRQKQFDNFDKTSSFNCFDVKFNNSNNENLINFQQTTSMPAFESECSMEKFRRQIINSNDELNTKFSPITNDIASWNDYVTKIIDEDDDSFDVDNNNDKENQNDSIECLFESINLSDDDNQSIDIDSNKLNDVDDNSIIENNNTNNNSSNIIQHDDSIRTIEHCQHVSPESKQIESVMQPNVDNIDDGNSILINEIAATATPLRDRCVSLNTGTMMIMNDPKAAHLLTCQHYHHHHQQQQQQQYHQNHTHHLNHQTINHHKRRSMSSNDSILSLLSHSTLINNPGRNRSNTVSTMIGGYCTGNSSNTNDILIQSKRFIKFDRYKTELCIYKSEIGECPYGDQCCFAHGLDEIRPRPLHDCKERTQPCESFSKGVCYRGSSRCWYLHPKPEFNMERLRNDLHHWLFNEKFDKDLFIENSKEWFDDDWDPKFHELISDNNNNYKSLVEQSKDNDFDDINMDIRFDFGDKELNEYFDFQCNYYPLFKDIMQSITMMVKKSETKTNITINNSNDESVDNPKFHYNWSKAGCSAATDNVIRQSFHSILSNSTIKNEHIENKHVNSNQNTDQSSSIQALLSEISNLSLDHDG